MEALLCKVNVVKRDLYTINSYDKAEIFFRKHFFHRSKISWIIVGNQKYLIKLNKAI